jgi:threonyl-tRNA synthetase
VGRILLGEKKETQLANYMKILRSLEIVDYEPASNPGNFRFYPRGALMFLLIKDLMESEASSNFGSLSVLTPMIYSYENAAIQGQAGQFYDRLYKVYGSEPDENLILRFNGDVGCFEAMKAGIISHRQLPFRVHEFATSFRYNMSGELSGIRRARNFSFLDLHSFSATQAQAILEYQDIYRKQMLFAERLGLRTVPFFRVQRDFYRENKSWLVDLIRERQTPVLLEIMPDQSQYWAMKNVVFTEAGVPLFHIQLDLENGQRYGIKFVDTDGLKKNCAIIHVSFGSVEEWMVFLTMANMKNPYPSYPLWLSPIQVRIIPVSARNVLHCLRIAQKMNSGKIRADVDDRQKTVGARIRNAFESWVPYLVICGDEETKYGIYKLSSKNEVVAAGSIDELIGILNEGNEKWPYRPWPGVLVSKIPAFGK